jgi:hypothetical protein
MNSLICEHPFLVGVLIASILATILITAVLKPWWKFVKYSKDDINMSIYLNKLNNKYYFSFDQNTCYFNKYIMTNSQIKEEELKVTNIKNKIKMENSKPSLLLKILKYCFLIIIIILTYKIGVVIIETVPNLVKNQLTIQK